jgi:hypothetical protein
VGERVARLLVVNTDNRVVYDETCIMFRTMRNVGFLNRVRETAAFNQLLAMSSWHLSHLIGNHQATEHLGYSLVATQQLQNQINDLKHSTTDYAISAVLAFVCCAVSDPGD